MENSSSKSALSGFAAHLAENALLDKQVALNALSEAIASKTSYIDYLAKHKILDESQVAWATAEYFGLPLCDISAFDHELIPLEYLNFPLVKKKLALPVFQKSGLLYMAIIDPTIENLYEARFLTGLNLRFLIVEASKLAAEIDEILNARILTEISVQSEEMFETLEINAYKEENADLSDYDAESAPVINYLNRVLLDAIEKGASDIHFERYENTYRIRIRQQGILRPITSPPLKLANYLLARVKVMSNLDITEHRIPQDGRFKLIISKKRSVDFRVSVCPTIFGEKVVLRILDPVSITHGVEKLGMDEVQTANFMSALQRSQGMILVTGPTGSGKTVTLYSALNYLNSQERNISTVEDPVEIPMLGINQVHVNPRAGLTFATALRSFLRQDPDIIMVGEIRDLDTAEIAVKAAQTGHLVLSTLHTNSAPETINRLINMGIASYNIASALTIIVAQRLVRILCTDCKVKLSLPDEVLIAEGFQKEEVGTFDVYGPTGCERCYAGYLGRLGIFEVLPITTEMSYLILEGTNTAEIVKQARKEGVIGLREAGLNKVKEGVISLDELNRVFK
ncbi:MAG: type IV-A pilus assembly ATPase PilB [Gammaproteobacteria bacterium]|nr:type IV-A pilus assembly ATPase PilB [Gammaproteobacteria bacterium]